MTNASSGPVVGRRQFGSMLLGASATLGTASGLGLWRPAAGASLIPAVVVNQVGYRPELPKRALLIGAELIHEAQLVDVNRGTTVAEIVPQRRPTRTPSGDPVAVLDFSEHAHPGRYVIRAGQWQSYTFAIERSVWELPMVLLLRSFYLQRCGVAVRDNISGLSHGPCHRDDAYVRHGDAHHTVGERLDLAGGWHDAGDFGKYVGPTAVTLGRLLTLLEQHGELFTDGQLVIPESGDGRPDVLSEAAVGLDWLLAMQRPDGAFYRKVAGESWPGMVMPEADGQRRYAYGPATSDTAKATAALALGARLWRPFDAGRAERYLAAAERGWRHLKTVPEQVVDDGAGDDAGSGRYLFSEIDDEVTLTHDRDDRAWAAAELYLTTRQDSYEEAFEQLVARMDYGLFEWKDPSPLGLANYLFASGLGDARGLKERIGGKLIRRANQLLERVEASSYGIALDEFKWGSNKMAAEEGITLALAYRLTQRSEYLVAAVGQLDYLLGRNHFNKSFVTGVGADPVMNMHHRLAVASGRPLPGFLVGGPNDGAQSGIAPKGRGPLSYADDAGSYATNESAIDYNASLLGLIGELATVRPV